MSLYKRKRADGSFDWYAVIQYKGHQYHENLKVNGTDQKPNIKEAGKQHKLFHARAIQQGNQGPAVEADTLRGFKEKFFAHITGQCSPSTLRTYQWAWAFFQAPEFCQGLGDLPLNQIDNAKIEEFSQRLQRRDLSKGKGKPNGEAKGNTVNMVLKVLRRALRLAYEWGTITKVPKIRQVKNVREREYVITVEREEKLVASAPLFMRLLVPFLIDTGLRLGEACNLRWEHIDFQHNRILVRATPEHRLKTKNAKREVPMTPRVKTILQTKRDSQASPFVWPAPQNPQAPLNGVSADSAFRAMKQHAHITAWDCVLHACRHTFCSNLGNAGMDANTIMRLAGHSSIVISAKYVHTSEARLQEAVAMMAASTSQPLQASATKPN